MKGVLLKLSLGALVVGSYSQVSIQQSSSSSSSTSSSGGSSRSQGCSEYNDSKLCIECEGEDCTAELTGGGVAEGSNLQRCVLQDGSEICAIVRENDVQLTVDGEQQQDFEISDGGVTFDFNTSEVVNGSPVAPTTSESTGQSGQESTTLPIPATPALLPTPPISLTSPTTNSPLLITIPTPTPDTIPSTPTPVPQPADSPPLLPITRLSSPVTGGEATQSTFVGSIPSVPSQITLTPTLVQPDESQPLSGPIVVEVPSQDSTEVINEGVAVQTTQPSAPVEQEATPAQLSLDTAQPTQPTEPDVEQPEQQPQSTTTQPPTTTPQQPIPGEPILPTISRVSSRTNTGTSNTTTTDPQTTAQQPKQSVPVQTPLSTGAEEQTSLETEPSTTEPTPTPPTPPAPTTTPTPVPTTPTTPDTPAPDTDFFLPPPQTPETPSTTPDTPSTTPETPSTTPETPTTTPPPAPTLPVAEPTPAADQTEPSSGTEPDASPVTPPPPPTPPTPTESTRDIPTSAETPEEDLAPTPAPTPAPAPGPDVEVSSRCSENLPIKFGPAPAPEDESGERALDIGLPPGPAPGPSDSEEGQAPVEEGEAPVEEDTDELGPSESQTVAENGEEGSGEVDAVEQQGDEDEGDGDDGSAVSTGVSVMLTAVAGAAVLLFV